MKTVLAILGGIFIVIVVIDSLMVLVMWLCGRRYEKKRERQEQEIRVRLLEDADDEAGERP